MVKWWIGLKWQQELDRAVFGAHYCLDWVLKNSLEKSDLGIVLERWISSRYQQQQLSDLDFVDYIALTDDSEQRLQYATSEVEEKGQKVGLTINSKKTKVMDVGSKG